jgi:hypothetical protein
LKKSLVSTYNVPLSLILIILLTRSITFIKTLKGIKKFRACQVIFTLAIFFLNLTNL